MQISSLLMLPGYHYTIILPFHQDKRAKKYRTFAIGKLRSFAKQNVGLQQPHTFSLVGYPDHIIIKHRYTILGNVRIRMKIPTTAFEIYHNSPWIDLF